ncbi:MAG: hypothetical protein AB7S38_15690 [Vulcanimicrobiota bacterium]
MRFPLRIFVLLFALCLAGCSTGDSEDGVKDSFGLLNVGAPPVGAVQLQFQDAGAHGRFIQASQYQVRVVSSTGGTDFDVINPVTVARTFTQFDQNLTISDVPTGTYDILALALDANATEVGRARASNVPVIQGQTTVIDGTTYSLIGEGVSAGVDFTGVNLAPAANPAGGITVTAGPGTTPTYTFTGGPVRDISVLRIAADGSERLVWGASSVTNDALNSPIMHGPQPAGATLLTANIEPNLATNAAYRVVVVRTNGQFGTANFTP